MSPSDIVDKKLTDIKSELADLMSYMRHNGYDRKEMQNIRDSLIRTINDEINEYDAALYAPQFWR